MQTHESSYRVIGQSINYMAANIILIMLGKEYLHAYPDLMENHKVVLAFFYRALTKKELLLQLFYIRFYASESLV